MRKHLLFLCSRNKLRSPTAEAIFADHPAVEVDSAGLCSDAEVPVTLEQIEWADLILVMEPVHRRRLNQRFGRTLAGKQVVVLDIPDRFEFMESALVELLKQRCGRYFPTIYS
jgi:predicted protein tyrosine phosphatase